MDFANLPEPWNVEIFYGEGIWRKPPNSKMVYVHLRGAGGAGGAGQSGTAGTKRAGGSGGTGGYISNYFGPSCLFDDVMRIGVATTNATPSRIWFSNSSNNYPEFMAVSGGTGNAGANGTGGAVASYARSLFPGEDNLPIGILKYNRSVIMGRTIDGGGTTGGYSGGGTNPGGGMTLHITNGCGGGGITDTFGTVDPNNTRGGGITVGGGQGNGIIASPGNLGFLNIDGGLTDGASGQNGIVAWLPGKAMYLSTGAGGGAASANGTGGRGGDGAIGCGGGGGGGGVTGGVGGRGGTGIAIILSW